MQYFVKSKLRSKASRARIKRWLEALEGNEYFKIRGDYNSIFWNTNGTEASRGFCALGVAADVNGVDMDDIHDGLFESLLGLKPGAHDRITGMNDNDGLPFRAIAEQMRDDLKSGDIKL